MRLYQMRPPNFPPAQMARGILEQPWQLGDTVLYRRMAPQAKAFQPGELRALLLGQLEQDPGLSWLREHPRAQALLQRIHP